MPSGSSSLTYINPLPLPTLVSTSAPLPEPSIHSLPTRTIMLASSVHITFNEDDICMVPSISFARNVKEDLSWLNAMWDNTTHHWGGKSFLHIKDHPIPIIYWKAVYTLKHRTGWKPGKWKIQKGNVFDWKVLRISSMMWLIPDVFLPRFWSDDGERALQTNSGRSSQMGGKLWVTRASLLDWQHNERRGMRCGPKKRGMNLAPLSMPHSPT